MAFPDPEEETTYVSAYGVHYEWDPSLKAWTVTNVVREVSNKSVVYAPQGREIR